MRVMTPILPPEHRGQAFDGKVYGHPRFNDGDRITTSNIIEVKNGRFITQSGSEYELGEVDPAYEAAFPGAKQRALDSLCKGVTSSSS